MKSALVVLMASLTTVSTYSQGTVAFHNLGSLDYRLTTNNLIGGSGLACCGLYRIGLYVSSNLSAPESALNLVAIATNAAPLVAAGRFNGGTVSVSGLTEGSQIRFQLRAWSLAGGFSYEEAIITASMNPLLPIDLGQSLFGTTTLGSPVLPAPLFGTSPGLLTQGFCIGPFQCVPEPSTSALGVLAALSLMMARRRCESKP